MVDLFQTPFHDLVLTLLLRQECFEKNPIDGTPNGKFLDEIKHENQILPWITGF